MTDLASLPADTDQGDTSSALAMTDGAAHLDVTLLVRAKHADLWDAAKKLGGQSALARELGVSPHVIGEWINLRRKPAESRRDELEPKLFKLTGKLWDELFPLEIMDAEFFRKAKSVEIHRTYVENHGLSYLPEERGAAEERRCVIQAVLKTLTYREREILKWRFGLGDGYAYTLAETARVMGVTRERIRQIESKAIRKLQQSDRSEALADVLPGTISEPRKPSRSQMQAWIEGRGPEPDFMPPRNKFSEMAARDAATNESGAQGD
jgi:RNA polymerase sigma factor (sigma-70 family)